MTMAWECPKNCTIQAWNQEIVTTSGGKLNGTQKQVSAFSTRKLSWNELWRSEVVIAKKNKGRLKKKTKKLRFRKCSTTVRRDWRCWSPRLARREAIQVRTVAIAVLNLRMNFSRCMPNYRPDGPHRGQWGLICPPIYFGIPYINPYSNQEGQISSPLDLKMSR